MFTKTVGVWSQQGSKLVGTAPPGPNKEGFAVGMSPDGHTIITGVPADSSNTGGAWIYIRPGSTVGLGRKVVGSDAVGNAQQGSSVALSADGNTAIIGGPHDTPPCQGCIENGAAWVFTRSGFDWNQQGSKLIGSGAIGGARQGYSVALSADGNTAIVGGPYDNTSSPQNGLAVGAAWVFTRSGGVWSQQGNKLVGTGAVGSNPKQGVSVALSADGNTAIVGGIGDGGGLGAAWVFTRSGTNWTQQGKLVGSDFSGFSQQQGYSVALSADGNTAIVGGRFEGSTGAAWIFVRSNGLWSQLGSKLVGSGAVGIADQGTSVALSGDGNVALVGGPSDNGQAGAVWVFVRPDAKLVGTATHNLNGDAFSDIVWRHTSGTTAAWLMAFANVIQSRIFGTIPGNWDLVGQRDFDNDGKFDFLWRDATTGTVAVWLLDGLSILQTGALSAVPSAWQVAGTSDFNYDGKGDILWRNTSDGTVAIWLLNGLSVLQSGALGIVPLSWTIAASDDKGNIFWRDSSSGALAIWEVYGLEVARSASLGTVPLNWTIAGVGDFDGNGSTDIVWSDSSSGTVAIWLLDGMQVKQSGVPGTLPGGWSIVATGDYNGDGRTDLLLRDASGNTAIWFINGLQLASTASLGTISTSWAIQSVNAD
ncbi:MAG: FG-GAP-like repeat-containing protein [Xanthobacteraceae bacterium]